METRSIAIGLIAIVAAFAAAFGMAKSGGSKTETAGAGVKAQSIKLAAPAAVTGVQVGGTVPALKTVHKAPAKKKKAASTTNTSSTANTNTTAPSTNNTATPQATAQPPVKIQVPVTKTTPPKQNTGSKPNPAPAQGGGEDG